MGALRRAPCGLVGLLGPRRGREEQEVAFDDGTRDVAEFAAVVLGVVAEHFEGLVGVDRVAAHEDAFALFD